MLRISTNINDLRNADVSLPVITIDFSDGNTVFSGGVLKRYARVFCDSGVMVSSGEELLVDHLYSTRPTGDDYFVPSTYSVTERRTAKCHSDADNSFCVFEDLYYGLEPTEITSMTGVYSGSDEILTIRFDDKPHYFNHDDGEEDMVMLARVEDSSEGNFAFIADYVDEHSLTISNDDQQQQEWVDFLDLLFRRDAYERLWYVPENPTELQSLPYPVKHSDPKFVKIPSNENSYEYYARVVGTASLDKVSFFRKHFIYGDDDVVRIRRADSNFKIPISIGNRFETNTLQDENINEYFVDAEIENAIRPPLEMEKNVYRPAKAILSNSNSIVGFSPVDSIVINMHFRKRDNADWTTDVSSFWNGVAVNDDCTSYGFLKHTIIPSSQPDDESYFFSYGDGRESYQPDLLSYLGFKKDDVRFRKNKLKKSFVRLSFYDSNTQGGQSLQAYSTVTMDMEKLYSKLLMHGDDDTRYVRSNNSATVIEGSNVFLNGISVDREPCFADSDDALNDDNVESLRLSSRIEIRDRMSGNNSSEGFYLYLWKNSDDGQVPHMLYVKPEFNHAGFGRVIPMMMPYACGGEVDGFDDLKVKSFGDIMEDWMETNSDSGYGVGKYLRYSLINFKYQYSKELREYVYYLDPYTYGRDVCFNVDGDDGRITLNLYEAKVR